MQEESLGVWKLLEGLSMGGSMEHAVDVRVGKKRSREKRTCHMKNINDNGQLISHHFSEGLDTPLGQVIDNLMSN